MSDFKGLLKHSKNYFFSTIATKALVFISLPVYTHLMSVEEYGTFSVFMSNIQIFIVLLTLNCEIAISRFFYDASDENEFRRFIGSSINLSFIIFCLMASGIIVFVVPLSKFLHFEIWLTLAIIPVALYYIINNVFLQINQPLMQSKKIAIVSSVQAYLSFILSVIVILFFDNKKYYGQVLGTILAMMLLATYLYKQIKPYYIFSFSKQHIKYILNYSIPYIPYSLSGVILAQFGNIFIGNTMGFEEAGLYSFVTNISLIVSLVISITHMAWNPYYFNYMRSNDYESLDTDYSLIWKITLIVYGIVSLFGFEIGYLLGGNKYLSGIYILPIHSLGYVFYQLSYVYMRNFGYAKKTVWNAFVVFLSGFINLLLNSFLIPILHEMGAAISFCFSYIILFLLSYIINSYFIKLYTPRMILFLKPMLFCVVFLPVCQYLYYVDYNMNWLLFKISIFILFSLLVLGKKNLNIIINKITKP